MHGLQQLSAICVMEHAHAAVQGMSQQGLLAYVRCQPSTFQASLNMGIMLDT